MSKAKTNAMRILDTHNKKYNVITYDRRDDKIDGISVANKIGRNVRTVFKTLVAKGKSGEIYVFIIPVAAELDFKKAANITGEKKIEMIHVKDIRKCTGYIRGGCSPIGMKKNYPTFVDKSALDLDTIIVSGGKIGVQIELDVDDLREITKGNIDILVK